MKETWPNFFIVGAPRAGTTSLYEYLRQVPGIYMCPVREPHYFGTPLSVRHEMRVRMSKNICFNNQVKYLKFFQPVKDEVAIGEASASYLSDVDAPLRIKEAVPDARIVMILRDPGERAYSHYLLHVQKGWHEMPAEKALRMDWYLQPGLYAEQVTRYLEIFGVQRVKIFIFDDFIRDTKQAVREVLNFLGVNAEPPRNVAEVYHAFESPRGASAQFILDSDLVKRTARALIPATLRRMVKRNVLMARIPKPAMPKEIRKFLEDYYRDDVRRLEQILGRSLPWPSANAIPADAATRRISSTG